MDKVSLEEARWGAVCPDTLLELAHVGRQVLTLEAQKRLSFHVLDQGGNADMEMVDLRPEDEAAIEQVAALLVEGFATN